MTNEEGWFIYQIDNSINNFRVYIITPGYNYFDPSVLDFSIEIIEESSEFNPFVNSKIPKRGLGLVSSLLLLIPIRYIIGNKFKLI